MMIFNSKGEKETERIAEKIASSLDRNVICLYGDLGSGKTTFTKAFAKKLGIKERVISPTYILIRKYELNERIFYHIDAYRLTENDNNNEIKEILNETNGIVVIEWADKIEEILPKRRINIFFNYTSKNERQIRIEKS